MQLRLFDRAMPAQDDLSFARPYVERARLSRTATIRPGVVRPGQSGHPGSPHYDDLLDDWHQGKSYEFGQPAADTLQLHPA